MEYSKIPVIINNRDRLESLVSLIEWLEGIGHENIIVLDNLSTYPPLLQFYRECAGGRFYLREMGENLGAGALWNSMNDDIRVAPLIYTDPDIVPRECCPGDVVQFLYFLAFERFRHVSKVGLGLTISDIPTCYSQKKKVEAWELQFWDKLYSSQQWPVDALRTRRISCYDANVDTTFALYSDVDTRNWGGIRTGWPYLARHVDWYVDSANPTEEQVYYEAHSGEDHHWKINECSFEPMEQYLKEKGIDA